MENKIEYLLTGKYALFTDPVTKMGGEKCSYHLPTYQAIKGITESVYWKPTIIWIIDKVRIINKIQTEAKNVKPLMMDGQYGSNRHDLSIYTYLRDVAYQIQAHFEWNMQREDLAEDRDENKHYQIALRMLDKGGRRDIFLGTRECQGYVEPCRFGDNDSYYDKEQELSYGLQFHSFSYPSESGKPVLSARFWQTKLINGIMEFPRPEKCQYEREIGPSEYKIIQTNIKEVIE